MSILNYIEAFTFTVKTGSFTAAAEQLGLSKSYVSKQVSQLESEQHGIPRQPKALTQHNCLIYSASPLSRQ
jgi:hypothetical protein